MRRSRLGRRWMLQSSIDSSRQSNLGFEQKRTRKSITLQWKLQSIDVPEELGKRKKVFIALQGRPDTQPSASHWVMRISKLVTNEIGAATHRVRSDFCN